MIKQSETLKRAVKVLILSVILSSCEKEDEFNNPDITPVSTSPAGSSDVTAVADFLASDRGLKIVLLTDEGDDETYLFDSYLFEFNTNGTVPARDAGRTVNGSYAVFRDDGKTELRMSFPSDPSFSELNDDWYFISFDENLIRFDDSGDRLEFKKQ